MNNKRLIYLIFDYIITILFATTLIYIFIYENIKISFLPFLLLVIKKFALIPYFKDVYKKPYLTITHSLLIVITFNIYLGLIISESIQIKHKFTISFIGILIYTLYFLYQIKSDNK